MRRWAHEPGIGWDGDVHRRGHGGRWRQVHVFGPRQRLAGGEAQVHVLRQLGRRRRDVEPGLELVARPGGALRVEARLAVTVDVPPRRAFPDRAHLLDTELLAARLLAATDRVAREPDLDGVSLGYFGTGTGAAAADAPDEVHGRFAPDSRLRAG